MSSHHAQYEKKDIHIGIVFWTVIGLIALCLLTVFNLTKVFDYEVEAHRRYEDVNSSAKPRFPVKEIFPEPRLQHDVVMDMKKFKQHEDALLSSYAWINKESGIARVPVIVGIEYYLKKLGQNTKVTKP